MAKSKKTSSTTAKSKSKTGVKAKAKGSAKAKPSLKTAGKAQGRKPAQKTSAGSAKKSAVKKTAATKSAAAKSAPQAKKAAMKTSPSKGAAKISSHVTAKATARAGDFSDFFTPLDDRVLVQRSEAATRTAGGLYIPDTVSSADRPSQGRVVAVGHGHRDKKGRLRPLDVQLGDTVMFPAFSGSEVTLGAGESLLLLREEEIIAVVKG